MEREIVEIITKGTYVSEKVKENRYLMSIRLDYKKKQIAAILLECSTDEIIIVYFDYDPYYEKLKTMILQYRPVEILIDNRNIDENMYLILQSSIWQPVISF